LGEIAVEELKVLQHSHVVLVRELVLLPLPQLGPLKTTKYRFQCRQLLPKHLVDLFVVQERSPPLVLVMDHTVAAPLTVVQSEMLLADLAYLTGYETGTEKETRQ